MTLASFNLKSHSVRLCHWHGRLHSHEDGRKGPSSKF